jgi:4-amino-4-deoxy-L-arabinose transferase-like glycosyltransferase
VFIPFIGNCPLFDWDEVNFAECAREMVVSGNYSQVQLNFQPFWEKPPFFIWLQALSMNIFGVNEFAARLPNAACGIVTLLALFHIGRKFHSSRFGLMWSFIYASLILPHLYFHSGIIDPWFNLFIFLSVYNIILFFNNPTGKKEMLNAVLAGSFLGLAVLTKGPAALVIAGLTVIAAAMMNRDPRIFKSRSFLVFCGSTLLVACSWFIYELSIGNLEVIREFVKYQMRLFETGDAGHDGPFYYHALVILVGCFPASFIFIAAYRKKNELTPFQLLFRRFMICLFWVVLILFSIVKTKIVHYSSLCYFPLTFIATLGLVQYYQELRFGKILKALYWIVSAVLGLAFIALGFMGKFSAQLRLLVQDEIARENLKANVSWTGAESLIGVVFLTGAFLVYISLRKDSIKLFCAGMAANLLFIYLAIVVIIPKVELYTQQAAIDFYKACASQKCYIETHRFKSYAYLFYSNRQPSDYVNPDQIYSINHALDYEESRGNLRYAYYANANCQWMKRGKIDRPAYMVAKTHQKDEVAAIEGFKELYEKNGFAFFVRMPHRKGNNADK